MKGTWAPCFLRAASWPPLPSLAERVSFLCLVSPSCLIHRCLSAELCWGRAPLRAHGLRSGLQIWRASIRGPHPALGFGCRSAGPLGLELGCFRPVFKAIRCRPPTVFTHTLIPGGFSAGDGFTCSHFEGWRKTLSLGFAVDVRGLGEQIA